MKLPNFSHKKNKKYFFSKSVPLPASCLVYVLESNNSRHIVFYEDLTNTFKSGIGFLAFVFFIPSVVIATETLFCAKIKQYFQKFK
ncbi:MAG: hypothetical protein EAZ95_07230 [Bacteroidetes bacterium]|nr:MAG: hypothetical protein EAZ95_07230 [Bacteroidota bacterium]